MKDHSDRSKSSGLDLLVDAICDDFERELQNGRPKPIDRVVAGYAYANKSELFRELLYLELTYTAADQRQPLIEHYIGQFPEYIETLLDALSWDVLQSDSQPGAKRKFPEGPADPPAPELSSDSLSQLAGIAATSSSTAPTRVGSYRLLRSLGEGGFGTVYIAHDEKLRRIVALKIPHVHDRDDDRERFFREARNAARLDHPGIVRLYDSGESNGVPYLAMEYIRGKPLAGNPDIDALGKKTEWRRSARLVVQIAEALAHAHARGVVHRDLKPSNILVDSKGQPHVTDFGLAKREFGEATLTGEGKLLGTLAYMAPEQAADGAHYVDGRADLYSLGVILFELLTGHLPFSGTPAALLNQLLHDDPPPPSRLVPGISKDLDTICARCLEKSPANRYASADQLATDLRLWLEGLPIHARPLGWFGRGVKLAKRHPLPALLGSALTAAMLCIALLSLVAYSQARASRHSLALGVVGSLQHAAVSAVPDVLQLLEPFMSEVGPDIRQILDTQALNDAQRVRLSIACQDLHRTDVAELISAGLRASYGELSLYRLALTRHAGHDVSRLWQVLSSSGEPSANRLKALYLLSSIDPSSPQWADLADDAAQLIVECESPELPQLLHEMAPCPQPVLDPLERTALIDSAAGQAAALALIHVYHDQPVEQVRILLAAHESHAIALLEWLQGTLPSLTTERQLQLQRALAVPTIGTDSARANQIIARSMLGDDRPLLDALAVTQDTTLRTELMVRLDEVLPTSDLVKKLELAEGADQEQAILIAIGDHLRQDLALADPEWIAHIERRLLSADSGVHCAAEWALARRDTPPTSPTSPSGDGGPPAWYRTSTGLTMVLIRPTPRPDGVPPEVGPGHAFYLASSETTVEQFAAFRAESAPDAPDESPSDSSYSVHHPRENVTYQEVVGYCNWLSRQEGIPESQWCYQPQVTGKGDTELLLVEDPTQRRGYRLPTTAEWDFACHGYSVTRHHFGNQLKHVTRFGWALQNSGGKMQPVKQLWPDRQGLFDMLGNAMEMCQIPDGQSISAPFMGGSATAANRGLGMPGAFITTQFALVQGGFRVARSVVPSN